VRALLASGGLRAFIGGSAATVARDIPFAAVQFTVFERSKQALLARAGEAPSLAPSSASSSSSSTLPWWQSAAVGFVAGGTAAAATTPLDVARTRILTAPERGRGLPPPRVWDMLRTVAAEGGVRGLFRGVAPRVAWISIGGSVFLSVYEQARRWLV
jgi:solute carrier family 25 S-adenosylmethionine transporter 26